MLTAQQKESIEALKGYMYDSELNNLCNSMGENGYSDKTITRFLSMDREKKIKFLTKENLNTHVFFHLLILETL